MNTNRFLLALGFCLLFASSSVFGYELTVVNTSEYQLQDHPVELDLSKLPDSYRFYGITVESSDGTTLPAQPEDLNGDQRPETLVFLVDLEPAEARTVRINVSEQKRKEPRRVTGEERAWINWSEPHLENRQVRWELPPSRPRGVRSHTFPPDTPMPYEPRGVFRVLERSDEEVLFDFTLESEDPVELEQVKQEVVSGPVRAVVKRERMVRPVSSGEKRFHIDERFTLYEKRNRMDVRISITNPGEEPRKVPGNLRILDGELGDAFVRNLGQMEKREGAGQRHSKLRVNGSTKRGFAYIPHGPRDTGWGSRTLGVDYFRFAPSPGPKFRMSGVGEKLSPGQSKQFQFSFVLYRGEQKDVQQAFRKDANAIPGVVSLYGENNSVLKIAPSPPYILNGAEHIDRWLADEGVNLSKVKNGISFSSQHKGRGIRTGFTRDFGSPTELTGEVSVAEGTNVELKIEQAENGEMHSLGTIEGKFQKNLTDLLPFDRMTSCMLHLNLAGEGNKRSATLKELSISWPMRGTPELMWPRDEQTLSDVGVSFSFKSQGGSIWGYQIQVASDVTFENRVIDESIKPDSGLKGEGGLTKYLPDEPLEKGTYQWRVRPLLPSGQAGAWTESRSFQVDSTDRTQKPPVRPISPEKPVLFGGLKGDQSTKAFAKEVKKQYPDVAELIIQQRGYDPGKELPLPIFVNTSSKPTLPKLEYAFRNEENVLGMVFREYGFDRQYLRRVLALAAKYGRYVSALNLGDGIGQRSFLTKEFYPAVKKYGKYLLPQRKMNNRRDQTGHLLTEIGAYVTGRVGNWGVESEWGYAWKTMSWKRWTRTEAVNRPVNYMPTFVFGLSTGASFYRLEGLAKRQIPYPFDRKLDEKFGPLWKRAVAPFFQDIARHDLIPSIQDIRKKMNVAVAGKKKYGLKRPGSPGTFFPNRVVAALHGIPIEGVPKQHIFENQWVPDSSEIYVAPVLPAYTPPEEQSFLDEVLDPDEFRYPEDAAEQARSYYPASPEDNEAYSVRVGDTGVVLNSIDERRDPQSGPQTFRLDLTKGPVAEVSGELDFQAYVLMKQKPDELFLHANNFPVNYTNIRLKSRNGKELKVRTDPGNALRERTWNEEEGVLELRLNHHSGVARVTVEQK